MRKKMTIASFVLSFTLIFSSSISVSASDNIKEFPENMPLENYLPTAVSTESHTSSFTIQVGKDTASATQTENMPENKISHNVIEKSEEVGSDTPIRVRVGLSYEYDVNQFTSRQMSIMKESTTLKTDSNYTFVADLTEKQIKDLAEHKEVFWISLDTEMVTATAISTDIEPFLNASTEMTGAKKARQDFGATGNRAGSETTYSAADVVIAVVDSGIDASHVDLDGGKVIGWNDLVANQTTAYDDNGHGTHVASIAAGTGEGDPGIETGYAPGAALVGVKVLDSSGSGSIQNIANGINWIVNNNSTLGVEIINLSIQSFGVDITPVRNAVNNARNNGIITVIAAGNFNNAPYAQYDSLSDMAAIINAVIVGNMVDPYEGGWYISKTSRRGTSIGSVTTGPTITAPGTNIRAAAANTINGYTTKSGTSMAAPAVSGILALMNDASNGSVSYNIITEGFGEAGFDPVTGHGEIVAYDSIKGAGGFSSGSFDDFRDHLIAQDTINQGFMHTYTINVYNTASNLYFASSLLMLDEDTDDFDLFIWGPGKNFQTDTPDYSSVSTEPQEVISFVPTVRGTYTVGVHAFSGSGEYTLDFSGQIN